jgi:hypothetical protein
MRSLVFTFLVLITLSIGFVAVGMLIVFWPTAYLRWIHWSKVEDYAPWLVRGWGITDGHYGWRVRIVGLGMALFGVTFAVLSIWACWFQ